MVQGGLSSTTRTCGKPSCACHSDPARRHGPNLYFTWRDQDKSHALYVPPQHAEEARAAQAAWTRFWEIAGKIAALNREQLQKHWARAKRAAANAKASPRTSCPTPRRQRTFADGFITEEVDDLWEPWMRQADEVLQDEELLNLVQQELVKRCRKSKTRGRPSTTAEVALRLLLLKHIRDWSYEVLTREVRANLVYREFTRIGGARVPDDKTIGRLGRQLGPEVITQIHQRVVQLARERNVVSGRKMRVDTTVVEANIHYPTDSTLLGDGLRVLTRVMRKVQR